MDTWPRSRATPRAQWSCQFLIAVMAWLVCGVCVSGQDEFTSFRPADTSSPRATLHTFIKECNEFFEVVESQGFLDRRSDRVVPVAMRLLDCLDTSELAGFERLDYTADAAVYIKEILDRVELPPESEIPDAKIIREAGEDGLTQWRIPGTKISIARVEQGAQQFEYLFSPSTLSRARSYYQEIKSLPYRTSGPPTSAGLHDWYFSAPGHPVVASIVNRLPNQFRADLYGLSIWKWVGLLLCCSLTVAIMTLGYRWHGKLASRYRGVSKWRYGLTLTLPALVMLAPLVFNKAVYEVLTIRGEWLHGLRFTGYLAMLLASIYVVFNIGDRVSSIVIASPHINPRGLDAQFVRILTKLSCTIIGVLIFLQGGQFLGIPLTTLLASAGVGGLAMALAAQDTLRNLFGTIMLLSDKPFRIGERIVFDKYDGVVEDIGLRSTKVRLLTGHQATIPNDKLAGADVENVGRRTHIRRVADIRVSIETPKEKLEAAVESIRQILDNHEGMDPEFPPRVFFHDFAFNAYVIRIMYWYSPPVYWEYVAFSEKLNFELLRVMESHGVSMLLPRLPTADETE